MLRWFALVLGLALTGCQLLADIHTHDPDPLPVHCELPKFIPGPGAGQARLAHLFPTTDNIDVCVRTSGSPSYGRPVFRGSGTDKGTICGRGLAYSEATVGFRVPTGTLDFKIIPTGKTCSATALAEKTGVEVGTDVPVTIAYAHSPDDTGTVLAMYESTTGRAQNIHMRPVSTIPGVTLDWGIAAGSSLPTTLSNPFLSNSLGFGELPAKNSGKSGFDVDANGYVDFSPYTLPYGAARKGNPKMILLGNLDKAGFFTLYAIGAPGSPFPVRGLYCRDQGVDTADSTLQLCTSTDIESFKVDVYNAGLYGAFAAVENERAPHVIQDLAARGLVSDLLCVSEAARHAELDLPDEQKGWTQEALIAAALAVPGGFQYFAQGHTDLDTPFDEPANQNGDMPVPPDHAPCDPAFTDPVAVNTVYQCIMNNCSSEPGKDTGVISGGVNCYSGVCGAGVLSSLLFGDDNAHQCYNCITLNGISYLPYGKIKTRCATEVKNPLGFSGAASSMLLSKAKLNNIDQYVVPSTAFRRVALYAQMEYNDGNSNIDVYCIQGPPLLGKLTPYTSIYGNGAGNTNGAAWEEENIWGIQRIIGWIQRKSAGRPAIILGDWSASAKALDKDGKDILGLDGTPQVADVTPEGIRALQAAFTEAVPDTYKVQCPPTATTCLPQCTRCPAMATMGRLNNPYNSIDAPQWNLRVYIKDTWVPNPADSAELFYTELDHVTFSTPNAFGIAGPLADTFGFRVAVKHP